MPWAAAAAVVGAGITAYSADKAADQQADQAQAGIDVQQYMFDKGLEETAPFREAGISQLGAYQQLLTEQGRAEALSGYYGGEEYAGLEQQAEQSILRNQAATGGMRSGGTQAALAGIAPQLGQNYLNQQSQNQLALINVGQGLSGQAAQQSIALGGQQSALLQDVGAYQAGSTLAVGQTTTDLLGELVGFGQEKGYI